MSGLGAVQFPAARKGGLRSRLRQWLFPSSPLAPPSTWPAPTQAGGSVPHDHLAQAERCYVYAEQLNNQGSAELAVAFYRQAYVLIRPLLGLNGAPIGQQLALPAQISQQQAPPAVATDPVPSMTPLQARLEQLRRTLNATNAVEIQQELLDLQTQGHRDADLCNLLGVAALLRDQLTDAEQWFIQTLALEPNHLRALVNLGGLQLKGDRPEQAIEVLGRAVRLAPPGSTEGLTALTNLTLAHEKVGRTMDAAQLALRIFRIKPDHLRPASLVSMANTLEQMGEEAGAIEVLRYLSRNSNDANLKRRLAQLLERRGDFQQAAMVYRELLSQPQPAAAERS